MKASWIIFLISISSFLLSCEGDEKEIFISSEYIYNNQTTQNIKFTMMGTISKGNSVLETNEVSYNIPSGGSFSIKEELVTSEKLNGKISGYLCSNNFLGDSLKVEFGNDSTKIYYRVGSTNNELYQESNYQYNQINDNSVEFIYTFK